MAKKSTKKSQKNQVRERGKRVRISQADIPAYSVVKALRVAKAIYDNYGKDATKPLRVAQAMNMSPTTGSFRMMTGAAVAYGLTDGGYGAATISLTPLARRILAPTREGDDLEAKREATLKPKIISDFLTKYNDSPLPVENIAQNVLDEMGVPRNRTKEVFNLIKECATDVGFLSEIKGKTYVDLQGVAPQVRTEDESDSPDKEEREDVDGGIDDTPPSEYGASPTASADARIEKPKPIFIAHGKNKGPLDQLKKILDDFKIPYKVAVDEPNSGKLIPEKVKALMRECGSAIFLFTGNEGKNFTNKKGEPELERQVPNLNVVFELGAASILYNDRIIIFKEEGVEFASDFSSIGYISFENGNIQSKTGDLIRELVALGFIKITTAG